MAITLDKLSRTLGERTVTLRGEEVTVRSLSALQEDLLDLVYPRPGTPMKPDPHAGSQSEAMVPDTTNPVFRRELAAYYAKRDPAAVAVICDLKIEGQGFSMDWESDVDRARAWCAKARDFVLGTLRLTRVEMQAVMQASELCTREARAEAGKDVLSPSPAKEGGGDKAGGSLSRGIPSPNNVDLPTPRST